VSRVELEPGVRPDGVSRQTSRPPGAPDPGDGALLADLDRALYAALVDAPAPRIETAARAYLAARARLARPGERPFGLVNNRLYRADRLVVAPYLVDQTLELHLVRDGVAASPTRHALPPGTICTDGLILGLAGTPGVPVDLEPLIYLFDPEDTPVHAIARIRDAAALLRRVNETVNRNRAVFWLRTLAARLCDLSGRTLPGAKNLQSEIRDLSAQLDRLLDGPLRPGWLALSRLVVRNLAGVIGQPRVIDRLWQDTIDLAERHIPGSAIVNELRRTSHHALAARTPALARAYLAFLTTGSTAALAAFGLGEPTRADLEARGKPELVAIVSRVGRDLERVLGTSDVATRIAEWTEAYAEALLRCEYGHSIETELRSLLDRGLAAGNRWVYQHHRRILAAKAASFRWPAGIGADVGRRLERAATLPRGSGARAETARELGDAVRRLVDRIREAYEAPVRAALEAVVAAYRDGRFFEAFRETAGLRGTLFHLMSQPVPPGLRYYLYELDCLLEELGYLALRRVAAAYEERGVDLDQCLEVVRLAALNLRFDGLGAQDLLDFAVMLADPGRIDAERLDMLEALERLHHRVRQRVTQPYEKLRDRLGLGADELRLILGNMQRYLHDLNGMAQLVDIAAAHLRTRTAGGAPVGPPRAEPEPGRPPDPVLHLSHRGEIAGWVETRAGRTSLRDRYGGKASGLLYVSYLDLPTRDGFVLPVSFVRAALSRRDPERLRAEIARHLAILERDVAGRDGTPKSFGTGDRPLLLAVRGGSALSMPGILSTVVFVGLNDAIVETLAARDGPWAAYDSYRRFLASYAAAVWGVDVEAHGLVERAKRRHGVRYKQELPWEAMREVAEGSKGVLRDAGLGPRLDAILASPLEQLAGAVDAVMASWSTERARRFRRIKGISDTWHTAVIVQEMALGNRPNDPIVPGLDETRASLTGVITRTSLTDAGTRAFEGELKFSAAGDDLVGGLTFSGSTRPIRDLETLMPMLERRLKHAVARLRRFMGTDQEVEFTVERGVLSILQTRRAEAAFDRTTERFLDPGDPVTRGLGVRGGGFRGLVAFDEADLRDLAAVDRRGREDVDGVLLVIENPTPEDIPLIISADGLLTARGGSTSHAAVAINGIEDRDYAGVMSAANLRVHAGQHEAVIADESGGAVHRIRTGDVVSIHGTTGEVYLGSRRRQRVAA
jgi:hypothetical protein